MKRRGGTTVNESPTSVTAAGAIGEFVEYACASSTAGEDIVRDKQDLTMRAFADDLRCFGLDRSTSASSSCLSPRSIVRPAGTILALDPTLCRRDEKEDVEGVGAMDMSS